MFARIFLLISLALALAGCVTTNPHGWQPERLAELRLAGVEVEGIQVIRSWPAQETAFIRAKSPPTEQVERMRSEPASNFPDVRAFLADVFQNEANREVRAAIAPLLNGQRAVTMVIRLEMFDIPSAARRVLVDNTIKMKARIDLIDVASKQVVLSYDGPAFRRPILGGILGTPLAAATYEREFDHGSGMIRDYLGEYRRWLVGQ